MNETMPKYNVMDELKKPWIIVSLLFIALFLVTFFVLNSQLPDHLIVQWSNSDEPTGRIGKYTFFFVSTGIMLSTFLAIITGPKMNGQDLSENNMKSYRILGTSAFIVLYVVFTLIMFINMNIHLPLAINLALLIISLINLLLGIYFTKLTPNSIIGLRFSWIGDYAIWKKLHRISAYILLFISTVGIIVSLTYEINVAVLLTLSLSPITLSLIISFLLKVKPIKA